MEVDIAVRLEQPRGCGWRKPGGLYLVCDGIPTPCDLLPIPLGVCPVCHGGIKPSRGWTTIDIRPLIETQRPCSQGRRCPLMGIEAGAKSGLLWIGEKYYPTPEHWLRESERMGVSRRISQVPRDLIVGETWVFVAHRNVPATALVLEDGEMRRKAGPAIFHAFKPTAIEYIVRGNEDERELQALVKRGITPVRVIRDGALPFDSDDGEDEAEE
ncbi:MAG: hypothetical protein WAJ85_12860 [Candidatus Baltobacteraceae bacterium]